MESAFHQLRIARLEHELDAGRVCRLQLGVLLENRMGSPLIPPDVRKVGFMVVLNFYLLRKGGRNSEANNATEEYGSG
jgi:hypothetical protein